MSVDEVKLGTMSPEIDEKTLHDKVTRGAALTKEEQAVLAAWYSSEDAAEARVINAGGDTDPLASMCARIQTIEAENERLCIEIAALRHQLANTVSRSDCMSISELEEYEDRLARGEIK